MLSDKSLLVMHLRFNLAGILFSIAAFISTGATLLLPKTHPSRIYLAGRICKGRKTANHALSREAARATVSKRAAA